MPEPAFRGNLYRLRDQFDSGLFIGQGSFPNRRWPMKTIQTPLRETARAVSPLLCVSFVYSVLTVGDTIGSQNKDTKQL